jgi:hypothetical protein
MEPDCSRSKHKLVIFDLGTNGGGGAAQFKDTLKEAKRPCRKRTMIVATTNRSGVGPLDDAVRDFAENNAGVVVVDWRGLPAGQLGGRRRHPRDRGGLRAQGAPGRERTGKGTHRKGPEMRREAHGKQTKCQKHCARELRERQRKVARRRRLKDEPGTKKAPGDEGQLATDSARSILPAWRDFGLRCRVKAPCGCSSRAPGGRGRSVRAPSPGCHSCALSASDGDRRGGC